LGQDPDLPLAELLTEEHIQQACDDEGVCVAAGDQHVWTPALALWALLSQCRSDSKSCVAAVARSLVLRVGLGLPPCSAATGAYCKARAKLPAPLLRRLATHLGAELERQARHRGAGKTGGSCSPTARRLRVRTRRLTRPNTRNPARSSRGWASPCSAWWCCWASPPPP
jgi:hypothetical protein